MAAGSLIVKHPTGPAHSYTLNELRCDVGTGTIPRDWIARNADEQVWYRVGAFVGLEAPEPVAAPEATPEAAPDTMPTSPLHSSPVRPVRPWYAPLLWHGRMPRTAWWLSVFLTYGVFGWVGLVEYHGRSFTVQTTSTDLAVRAGRYRVSDDGRIWTTSRPLPQWVAPTAFVICIWVMLVSHVRRWHDRDKSGAMVLIGLIPVVGPAWTLIELGFLRGTVGPNRYGNDPNAPPPAPPLSIIGTPVPA